MTGGTPTYGTLLMHPADLPEGAVVTGVTCRYRDTSATGDISASASLRARPLTSRTFTVVTSLGLSSTGINDSPIHEVTGSTTHVVDNASNQYFLYVTWNSGTVTGTALRFYGCSVSWRADEAGP